MLQRLGTDFRGYDAQDIEGKMKKYAHILFDLNGGESCMRTFARKHPSIFNHKENIMKCLTYVLQAITN